MIYGNFFSDDTRGNNAMFGEKLAIPMGYYELLRESFLKRGVEINTPDLNEGKKIAFNLHIEGRPLIEHGMPSYLVALENPNHNHLNADREYCSGFSKVFSWNPKLFDLTNVVKVLPPHQIAHGSCPPYEERDIFSCMINGNKGFRKKLPSDLYLERIKVIRWYEKNVPSKFQLYGRGWNKPPPAFDILGKVRRSIPSLRSQLFGHRHFPSYKGEIHDKGDILRYCKFSYCYENNRDISNYVTEKIIDSLVYGCVPVYWGADNVLDYIPEGCFIDRRKFKSTEDVHHFLLSISAQQYGHYQSRILEFLKSEEAKRFSFEHFVSTVVNEISRDVDFLVT